MRLCRFRRSGQISVGFYRDETVIPIWSAAQASREQGGNSAEMVPSAELIDFLPPDGVNFKAARQLSQWTATIPADQLEKIQLATAEIELLVPIPKPNKLLLLAGNYTEHMAELGRQIAERQETFPYVFMKPPSTTFTDPGKPLRIPKISPAKIDWEIELAVIIGRMGKNVSEADALAYVAGYTVLNDISDRQFRPNPTRKKRDRDAFFDWQHGKWMDGFCPCGPAILTSADVADPQSFSLKLQVNGQLHQNGSTSQQVFSVAAVIEFISSFMTLEPGDIISTGTPSGVGGGKGVFLKAGDLIEAEIAGIGRLVTPVLDE